MILYKQLIFTSISTLPGYGMIIGNEGGITGLVDWDVVHTFPCQSFVFNCQTTCHFSIPNFQDKSSSYLLDALCRKTQQIVIREHQYLKLRNIKKSCKSKRCLSQKPISAACAIRMVRKYATSTTVA